MNTTFLHQKRVAIPALAAALVLAAAGSAWAETNDNVHGANRDRVAAAAVTAVGGGRAVDVERSDDAGEAYEVEVRQKDGAELDVTLDRNLKVLDRERDDADNDDGRDDIDDADDRDDDDAAPDNDDNPGDDDDADGDD